MKENQHFTGSLHSQRIEKTKYMLDAKNAECRGDKHVVVVEEGRKRALRLISPVQVGEIL